MRLVVYSPVKKTKKTKKQDRTGFYSTFHLCCTARATFDIIVYVFSRWMLLSRRGRLTRGLRARVHLKSLSSH